MSWVCMGWAWSVQSTHLFENLRVHAHCEETVSKGMAPLLVRRQEPNCQAGDLGQVRLWADRNKKISPFSRNYAKGSTSRAAYNIGNLIDQRNTFLEGDPPPDSESKELEKEDRRTPNNVLTGDGRR
ncbi:hypothetical protein F5876DRAFT_63459 [Lentinula aff. lateritia]|uniref:Uncharacterized protein n=1 Tax=Lentinula aff. lateritia TaxID=2804960 RepID=A0ACC1U8W0_9AGAR|nr:hypothetical protein F5876DRAFT_63459 [Lentinula aff. lateritia]